MTSFPSTCVSCNPQVSGFKPGPLLGRFDKWWLTHIDKNDNDDVIANDLCHVKETTCLEICQH